MSFGGPQAHTIANANVTITGSNKDLIAAFAQIQKALDAMAATSKTSNKSMQDSSDKSSAAVQRLADNINQVQRRLTTLKGKQISVEAADNATKVLDKIAAEAKKLDGTQIKVAADVVGRYDQQLQDLSTRITKINAEEIKVTAGIDDLDANTSLDELKSKIEELDASGINVSAVVDDADALKTVGDLSAAIDAVDGRQIVVDAKVDDADALKSIAELQAELNAIDKDINIKIDADTSGADNAVKAFFSRLAGGLGGGGGGGGAGGLGKLLFSPGGIGGLGALSFGTILGLGPEHLIGAGLSLGGSAAAGLAGGGLLAGGAAGTAAVGLGSNLAAYKSTITATSQLEKNYEALQMAISTYGASSRQAAAAQRTLNQNFQEAGPAAKYMLDLATKLSDFQDQFKSAIAPAQKQVVALFESLLSVAEAYLPKVGNAAQQNISIMRQNIQPFFDWLKGPQAMGIFDNLENNFKKNIPAGVHAMSQAFESIARIISLASNYTGGFTQAIDKFFTRINSESDAQLNKTVSKLVDDFRLWEDIVKNLAIDVVRLFRSGVGEGNNLARGLDNILKRWGQWEASAKGQDWLHQFFYNRGQELQALLKLVGAALSAFGQLYSALQPLVPVVTVIASGLADALKWLVDLGKHNSVINDTIVIPLGAFILAAKLLGGPGGVINTVKAAVSGVSSAILTVGRWLGLVGPAAEEEASAVDKAAAAMEAAAARIAEAAAAMKAAVDEMGTAAAGASTAASELDAATAATASGTAAAGTAGTAAAAETTAAAATQERAAAQMDAAAAVQEKAATQMDVAATEQDVAAAKSGTGLPSAAKGASTADTAAKDAGTAAAGTGAVGTAETAATDVSKSGGVLSKLGPVGSILAGLGTVGDKIVGVFSKVGDVISKVVGWFGKLGDVVKPLGSVMSGVGDAISGASKALGIIGAIIAALVGAVKDVKDNFLGLGDALNKVLNTSGIAKAAEGLWNDIKQLGDAIANVYNKIDDLFKSASGGTSIIKVLGDVFNALWVAIKFVVEWIGKILGAAVIVALVGALQGLKLAIELVIGAIGLLVKGSTMIVNSFLSIVKAIPGLISGIEGVGGAVEKWIVGAFNNAVNWLKGIPTFFENLGNTIVGALGGAFSKLPDIMLSPFVTGINWIIDRINDFIDVLDSINIKIPSVDIGPVHIGGGSIGFNIGHIGHIKMAEGGVVPGAGRGDKVATLLEPGEYVVKRDVASAPGVRQVLDTWNYGTSTVPARVTARRQGGGFVPFAGVSSSATGGVSGSQINQQITSGLNQLYQEMQPLTQQLTKLLDDLKKTVDTVMKAFSDAVDKSTTESEKQLKASLTQMVKDTNTNMNNMLKTTNSTMSSMNSSVSGGVSTAGSTVSKGSKAMAASWQNNIGPIATAVPPVFHDTNVNASKGLNAVAKTVQTGVKGITSLWGGGMQGVPKNTQNMIGSAITMVNNAVKNMGGNAAALVKQVSGEIPKIEQTVSNAIGSITGALASGFAQGGRLAGPGLHDSIPILAAPGEVVLNRHQESYLEGLTGVPGILDHVLGAVTRPHYASQGFKWKLPGFATGGKVGYGQLEGLWEGAGGPKNMDAIMAAIALAESGGDPNARNPSGASGLWQILGQIVPGNVFDPHINALNAVAKWKSQGLGAWVTYTSGAYKQYLHGNVPASAFTGAGATPTLKLKPTSGYGSQLINLAGGKLVSAGNAYIQQQASKLSAATAGGVGYQGYIGSGGPAAHAAYTGVLPVSRTDQGVDFTGSGIVRAVAAGRVLSTSAWPGWPGTGRGVVYSTAHGNVYDVEHVEPLVQVGQMLKAGDPVVRVLPGYPWLETGWANAAGTGPATPYNGSPDGTAMPAGQSFRKFIGFAGGGRVGKKLSDLKHGIDKRGRPVDWTKFSRQAQDAVRKGKNPEDLKLHAQGGRIGRLFQRAQNGIRAAVAGSPGYPTYVPGPPAGSGSSQSSQQAAARARQRQQQVAARQKAAQERARQAAAIRAAAQTQIKALTDWYNQLVSVLNKQAAGLKKDETARVMHDITSLYIGTFDTLKKYIGTAGDFTKANIQHIADITAYAAEINKLANIKIPPIRPGNSPADILSKQIHDGDVAMKKAAQAAKLSMAQTFQDLGNSIATSGQAVYQAMSNTLQSGGALSAGRGYSTATTAAAFQNLNLLSTSRISAGPSADVAASAAQIAGGATVAPSAVQASGPQDLVANNTAINALVKSIDAATAATADFNNQQKYLVGEAQASAKQVTDLSNRLKILQTVAKKTGQDMAASEQTVRDAIIAAAQSSIDAINKYYDNAKAQLDNQLTDTINGLEAQRQQQTDILTSQEQANLDLVNRSAQAATDAENASYATRSAAFQAYQTQLTRTQQEEQAKRDQLATQKQLGQALSQEFFTTSDLQNIQSLQTQLAGQLQTQAQTQQGYNLQDQQQALDTAHQNTLTQISTWQTQETQKIQDNYQTQINQLNQQFDDAESAAQKKYADALTTLNTLVQTQVNGVISSAAQALGTSGQKIWDLILGGNTEIAAQEMSKQAGKANQALNTTAKDFKVSGKALSTAIADGIKDGGGNQKKEVQDILDALKKIHADEKDNFHGSGKALADAIAQGIKDGKGNITNTMNDILKEIDKKLPHSDALEGPLSNLTASGASVWPTFAAGMQQGLSGLSMPTPSLPSLGLPVGPSGSFASSLASNNTGTLNINHQLRVEVDARGLTNAEKDALKREISVEFARESNRRSLVAVAPTGRAI